MTATMTTSWAHLPGNVRNIHLNHKTNQTGTEVSRDDEDFETTWWQYIRTDSGFSLNNALTHSQSSLFVSALAYYKIVEIVWAVRIERGTHKSYDEIVWVLMLKAFKCITQIDYLAGVFLSYHQNKHQVMTLRLEQ